MSEEVTTLELYNQLQQLVGKFKAAKPQDRSEQARRFAIVITDLEKVEAYTRYWMCPASLHDAIPNEE